jgi:hypothetical protein
MRKWILCLVAGLVLLTGGVLLTGDAVVRCAGVPMAPGETCRVESGSGEVVSRRTYAEVEQETEAAHRVRVVWSRAALVGGGVLTVLAGWRIVVRRRARANQGPTEADLFFQRRAAAQRADQNTTPPQDDPPT